LENIHLKIEEILILWNIGMCPKGDDPLTAFTDFRTIVITISSTSGVIGGHMVFQFNGITFMFPANGNYWTADNCKTSFENHPSIALVSCFQSPVDPFGASTYTVQFKKFSTNPYENNIYNFDGNPPLSKFSCDTSRVTNLFGVKCELSDLAEAIFPGNFS
jgi:hypothetical protein